MRRRGILFAFVAAVVAVVVVIGLRGRGKESPEKAIYALAHDVEHREADGVCERLFPSTLLPDQIARRLKVPPAGPGDRGTWEQQRGDCARDFGDRGEFESFGFEDPRVWEIKQLSIEPEGGVAQAAVVRVTLGGGREQTLKLVQYRGSWKLLFIVN